MNIVEYATSKPPRLDVSRYLSTRIDKVGLDWAFEQSDHASVVIELSLVENVRMGPGLTIINAQLLNDPAALASARTELIHSLLFSLFGYSPQ